jgi:hypothetical protein
MKLFRRVPGFGGLPELLSFYCTACKTAETIENPKHFN